jgi:hypothetical protein
MSTVTYLQKNILSSMVAISNALRSLNVVISALISVESAITVSSMVLAHTSVRDAYFVVICVKRNVLSNALHVVINATLRVGTQNARWNVKKYVRTVRNLVKMNAFTVSVQSYVMNPVIENHVKSLVRNNLSVSTTV